MLKQICDSKKKKLKNDSFSATKAASHYLLCSVLTAILFLITQQNSYHGLPEICNESGSFFRCIIMSS